MRHAARPSRQEIIRRYYEAQEKYVEGTGTENEIYKIQLLMKQASVTVQARKVVSAANVRAEATGAPAAAIELSDGTIVTGKTSDLLGASAALILNALKVLAGLDADMHLISPDALDPIRTLKVKYLGGHNPRLHTDEVLIALSSSASKNPNALLAMEQLPKLRGCQVHTSVLLSKVDINIFKKLGVNLTSEPKYEKKKLLH